MLVFKGFNGFIKMVEWGDGEMRKAGEETSPLP
jgi:hypothetical protein